VALQKVVTMAAQLDNPKEYQNIFHWAETQKDGTVPSFAVRKNDPYEVILPITIIYDVKLIKLLLYSIKLDSTTSMYLCPRPHFGALVLMLVIKLRIRSCSWDDPTGTEQSKMRAIWPLRRADDCLGLCRTTKCQQESLDLQSSTGGSTRGFREFDLNRASGLSLLTLMAQSPTCQTIRIPKQISCPSTPTFISLQLK
jgi:hypothetical protein